MAKLRRMESNSFIPLKWEGSKVLELILSHIFLYYFFVMFCAVVGDGCVLKLSLTPILSILFSYLFYFICVIFVSCLLAFMFLTAIESNSNESYNDLTEVIKLIYNRRQFVHFSSDYSKVQRH